MIKFRQIFYWAICLAVITSCTKNTAILANKNSDCGTVETLPAWTKTLSGNQLIGNWKITTILTKR